MLNGIAARGGCDEVVQWGFDETTLDGTACFNQWCLVRTGILFCLGFATVVYMLYYHAFLDCIFSANDTAARQEPGQTCVAANDTRLLLHMFDQVPDLQRCHS
jgi:hypothetical protein